MANFSKYDKIEKRILQENYGCSLKRFLNVQKINLELLSYYILNDNLHDKNECNNLLQEIIAMNMIITKRIDNVKTKVKPE